MSLAKSPLVMIFRSPEFPSKIACQDQCDNMGQKLDDDSDKEDELEDHLTSGISMKMMMNPSSEQSFQQSYWNDDHSSVTRDLMQYQKERYQQYLKLKAKLKKRQFTQNSSVNSLGSYYGYGDATDNNSSFRDENDALNMSIEGEQDTIEQQNQGKEKKQEKDELKRQQSQYYLNINDVHSSSHIKVDQQQLNKAPSRQSLEQEDINNKHTNNNKQKKSSNLSRQAFIVNNHSSLPTRATNLNKLSSNTQQQDNQYHSSISSLPCVSQSGTSSLSHSESPILTSSIVNSPMIQSSSSVSPLNNSFEENQQLMNSEILKSNLHCYIDPLFMQIKKLKYDGNFNIHSQLDNYCSMKKCPCLKFKRKHYRQLSTLPVVSKQPLLTIFENLAY